MAVETPVVARCRKQRSRLIGDHPWFGALSLRLGLHEEGLPRIDTAATDGSRLFVNPDWCGAQPDEELRTVIAHEVLHCALEHPYRIGGRDLALFNESCDHAVNLKLIREGFTLWKGALADPRFEGMYAEQIYAILDAERRDAAKKNEPKPEEGQGAPQDGQGQPVPEGGPDQHPQDGAGQPQPSQGQPTGCPGTQDGQGAPSPVGAPGQGQGEGQPQPAAAQDGAGQPQPGQFLPAPTGEPAPGAGAAERMTVEDWRTAVEMATRVDEKAGRMGGDLAREVREVREPQLDWREILRRFVAQLSPMNYSWSSPRRGFLGQGIYLPGTTKEGCPALAVAIDTSGSVRPEELAVFQAEVQAILREVRPARLDVLFCDTHVRHEQSFTPDGEDVKLEARGGGGTLFQPTLDRVTEMRLESEEAPAALVFLTDLKNGSEVLVEPDFPVLWVRTARSREAAPFGELVPLDAGDRR